jgi:hypothetical protein
MRSTPSGPGAWGGCQAPGPPGPPAAGPGARSTRPAFAVPFAPQVPLAAAAVSRYTRHCLCIRMDAPARWLHAAANASAASRGPSTPHTGRPIFASVPARAAAISGARPAMSSGTDGSWRNAPRGSLPSGGSHQPNSRPGPAGAVPLPDVAPILRVVPVACVGAVPGGRPAIRGSQADLASCTADSSSVFSTAVDLRYLPAAATNLSRSAVVLQPIGPASRRALMPE